MPCERVSMPSPPRTRPTSRRGRWRRSGPNAGARRAAEGRRLAAGLAPAWRGPVHPAAGREWQLDAHRQPAALAFVRLDPPTVRLDRPLRYRQPEAEAVAVASGHAGEGLEDAIAFGSGQAGATVLDPDPDGTATDAGDDLHRGAPGRMPQRVAHHVVEGPVQQLRVAGQAGGGRRAREGHRA